MEEVWLSWQVLLTWVTHLWYSISEAVRRNILALICESSSSHFCKIGRSSSWQTNALGVCGVNILFFAVQISLLSHCIARRDL
jgi:hypothetical protein